MGWRFRWTLHIERHYYDENPNNVPPPRRGKLAQIALVGLAVIGIVGVVIWRTWVNP